MSISHSNQHSPGESKVKRKKRDKERKCVTNDLLNVSDRFSAESLTRHKTLLRIVSSTKYLGVIFRDDLSWTGQFKSTMERAKNRWRAVAEVCCNQYLDMDLRLELFRTKVITALLYGCEVWHFTKTQYAELEAFERSCLRQLLGVTKYKSFPKIGLHGLFGFPRVTTCVPQRKLRFLFRLQDGALGEIPREILGARLSESTFVAHISSLARMLGAYDLDMLPGDSPAAQKALGSKPSWYAFTERLVLAIENRWYQKCLDDLLSRTKKIMCGVMPRFTLSMAHFLRSNHPAKRFVRSLSVDKVSFRTHLWTVKRTSTREE